MGKKFDKKNAQTFKLVSRSGGGSGTERVPITPAAEQSLQEEEENQEEYFVDEAKRRNKEERGYRVQFELGEYGFEDDGYDYSAHFAPMGGGKFFENLDFTGDKSGFDFETKAVFVSQNRKRNISKPDPETKPKVKRIEEEELEEKELQEILQKAEEDEIPPEEQLADDFVLQADFDPEEEERQKKIQKRSKREEVCLEEELEEEDDEFGQKHVVRKTPSQKKKVSFVPDDEDWDDEDDDDDEVPELVEDLDSKTGDLDKQFEQLMRDEYSDDEIGELDPSEIQGDRDLSQYSELFDQHLNTIHKTGHLNNVPLKNITLTDTGDGEHLDDKEKERILFMVHKTTMAEIRGDEDDSDVEEKEVIVVEKFDDKWDCESVLSQYSSYEHQARKIDEPTNIKKIELSSKTGIPLGVLPSKEKKQVVKKDNLGKPRDISETPEQRKERKKALKAAKKEGRVKKKELKMAYKAEEMKLRSGCNATKNVSIIPI